MDDEKLPSVYFRREQQSLNFATPTRCERSHILTVQSNAQGLRVLWFFTEAYLPQLEVEDRKGAKLIVIPRSQLDKEISEELEAVKKQHKASLPIAIDLDKDLDEEQYERIRISYLMAFGKENLKHKFGLIGYMDCDIPFTVDAEHLYLSISAPIGYELKVRDASRHIFHDERTYSQLIRRNDVKMEDGKRVAKVPFSILVPGRVTWWLVVALFAGIFAGPLAFMFRCLSPASVTASMSVIAAALTLMIAARVLLFENVVLLNRLNKAYLFTVVVDLALILIIASPVDWLAFIRILVLDP